MRIEDELVAVAAAGTVLSDREGRRRLVDGDRTVIPVAAAGTAPYRLESPTGEVLALSP